MGNKLNSINEVLENIEKLDIDDQAYISEVLTKRLIELRRSEIERRAIEAEQAYKEGKTKRGSFNDLWKDLND
ncbi:MAG: hypothetical protein ACUZ77_13190 [Candidatus Brocadiales bacterium]